MKSDRYPAIVGTVLPLPVPFNKDESVDYDGLAKYVRFLAESGIPNVMTTVGTSRFNILTEDEIRKVNETVVSASGDMLTIVANPLTGGTKSAIEFARHSKEIGADYFLCYFPERHYGEDNTYAFFQAVAEAVDIPILLHEMPMRNGLGGGKVQYSLDLLDRLLDIPNIVGFKEEALDADYSNQILDRFHDKAAIIGAGGGMSRYLLRDHSRKSTAFLGGIGNFYPPLELEFFEAISSGNQARAEAIVNDIELPYFGKVVPFGWHPTLKAALAHLGLMQPYERRPMVVISEEARKKVGAAVDAIVS